MDVLSKTKEVQFRYDEEWYEENTKFEYYIVQPAIKYHHLVKAEEFIDNEPIYKSLSEKEKLFYKEKLNEKIKGDMTEQIVLFDTKSNLPDNKYSVAKPVFFNRKDRYGEYDMLIWDKLKNSYWAFEIKHTDMPYYKQEEKLTDNFLKEIIDYKYGDKENVAVLYRGNPFKNTTGTYYINITDFAIAVNKYNDITLAMEELTHNIPIIDLKEYNIPLPQKIETSKKICEIDKILGFNNPLNINEPII